MELPATTEYLHEFCVRRRFVPAKPRLFVRSRTEDESCTKREEHRDSASGYDSKPKEEPSGNAHHPLHKVPKFNGRHRISSNDFHFFDYMNFEPGATGSNSHKPIRVMSRRRE